MKIQLEEDDFLNITDAMREGIRDAVHEMTKNVLRDEIHRAMVDSMIPVIVAAARRINSEVVLKAFDKAFSKAIAEVASGKWGG
jgi:hypothetical protein